MPALNFKKRYAELVETGEKQQSIRPLRRDGRPHCKIGDALKLYTGMRTNSCTLLGEGRVKSIAPVKIYSTHMELSGQRLPNALYSRDQLEPTDNEFAQADGFSDFMEMSCWFSGQYGLPNCDGTPFEGVVIAWELVQ
ncbi:MAG: hypothetical protein JXQ84_07775 [Rhodospirillaceae bacterium]|nr:hypothetical protein [Rhodospirillaceae bacterium]